jgi:hypothetical protein
MTDASGRNPVPELLLAVPDVAPEFPGVGDGLDVLPTRQLDEAYGARGG